MNTTPFRGWFTRLAARPILSTTAPVQFCDSISGRGVRPDARPPRHRAGSFFPGAASVIPIRLDQGARTLSECNTRKEKFTAAGCHHEGAMQDAVGLVSGCHQWGASECARRRYEFQNINFLNLPAVPGKRESGVETVWTAEAREFNHNDTR